MADVANKLASTKRADLPDPPKRRMSLHYVVFELLLGRALPGAFFAFFLLAQAAGVERRLAAAAGPLSMADLAYLLQRGLSTLFYALLVVLFIVRRPVTGKHSSPLGAAVALAGTFLILIVPLVVGMPAVREDASLLLASSAVILGGTAFTLFSLAALGRCFGIFPEARGLVAHGPYRIVRHPVYLGELASILGMVVATLSPLMLVLFLATVGLQYWRTIYEEQALGSIFSEYEEYRRRTPRLLPFVR